MSSKNHRSGGKYVATHTTVIPVAGILADIAHAQPEVTKIRVGFINPRLSSTSGKLRVKLTPREGNILLFTHQNMLGQELVVYTKCVQTSMLAIARSARDEGIHISFGKN